MTAMNIFIRQDAAHILTDGAFYDLDGIVHQITTKVAIADDLRMAMACSGRVQVEQLCDGFTKREMFSQERALALLPDVMREIREANRASNPELEIHEGNDLQIFVALFSEERQRPEAYYCSTNQAYFGPDYRPYTVRDVVQLSSPPVDLPFNNPWRDGLAIMEAQRRMPLSETEDLYFVGGFAELVTVTSEGVSCVKLKEWPDIVGEKISVQRGYITN